MTGFNSVHMDNEQCFNSVHIDYVLISVHGDKLVHMDTVLTLYIWTMA